jgi:hypothetical protein
MYCLSTHPSQPVLVLYSKKFGILHANANINTAQFKYLALLTVHIALALKEWHIAIYLSIANMTVTQTEAIRNVSMKICAYL